MAVGRLSARFGGMPLWQFGYGLAGASAGMRFGGGVGTGFA